MADKYIYHGATYNGDGTSSAAATSNGGVGAWNNINVFQGTAPAYGTLAAGDRVFVRTKDAAGTDITISTAAHLNLGSSAATELAPITWVFDEGTVWSGASGKVRVQTTANSINVYVLDWNNIKAHSYNLEFGTTFAPTYNNQMPGLGTGWTEEVFFDHSNTTNLVGPTIGTKGGFHVRPKVISARRGGGVFTNRNFNNQPGATFYDPDIELVDATEAEPVFSTNYCRDGEPVRVYGGRIHGVAADGSCPVAGGAVNAGNFMSFGLSYPREMPVSNLAGTPAGYPTFKVADGADGQFGSEFFSYYYAFTSRSDNYPPTLNAYLETSGQQPWSYRLYPYRTSEANPAQISLSKTWTQAPATRTITQELLWPTSMAAPTKDKVYLTVQYTDDATGLQRSISTRDMGAATLDASAAAWTATTWGMVAFDKYKLTVTTPTAIKQDTAVLVTLFVAPRSATVNDVLFVDPDPTFT